MARCSDREASGRDPRIAFFNGLADRWDSGEQDPAETVSRLAGLSDLVQLKPGHDLLEVGCGTGQITGWLASQVAPGRVVAVDFAEAMLDQARHKGIPAELRCVDVCDADLGERCFDVVFCFHSFPHFRDQSAALRHLARALRPTGRLLVIHLAGSAEINAFHDQVGGAVAGDHLPVGDAWGPLLASAGLRLQDYQDREGLFFLAAGLGAVSGSKLAGHPSR